MVCIQIPYIIYGLSISDIRYRYAIPIVYLADMYYFSIVMARQKGLLKITGTLGDVNFYISNGVGYARKSGGGFNGDVIKTKDSMVRVRENANEFGHCSRVKKQFRLALFPFLKDLKGKAFHTRLMQLFLELKALDAMSERGQRRVAMGLQSAKGRRLLGQFEFTPDSSLLNAVYGKASFDWANQTLQVSGFNPSGYKAPTSATHIGVILGVLDFDFETLESGFEVSPTYLLAIEDGLSTFQLTPKTIIPPAQVGIAILGVRYYEVIEDDIYGLESSIGVRVLANTY